MKYKGLLAGSNYVTHRAIGDIPGCVPAVDVFIERTLSEVRAELENDPAWDAYLSGETKEYRRTPMKFFRNAAKANSFLGYKS